MSKVVMVGSESKKESEIMEFSGASAEEIADKVALFMASRGYRLETGDKVQGVYGRGSAAWHAMLGPLVRRLKCNVTVAESGENVKVVIAKGMTGWGGGALGATRVKKELRGIMSGLQSSILS